MTTTTRPRPPSLTLAAVLVWLFAAAVAVIGVGAIAQFHGRFSAGVGAMLLTYAAALGWVGYAAWRCRFYSRGVLVATGMLHLLVALSSLSAGNVAVWVSVAALSAATVVCAMLPSTAAAIRVGPDPGDSVQ